MFNKIQIYFSEDTELSEFESFEKGFRNDVIVKVNGFLYEIIPITIQRLLVDFNYSIDKGFPFDYSLNYLLVKDCCKSTIIEKVKSIEKGETSILGTPLDLEKKYNKYFTDLKILENWVQVY